MAKKRIPNTTVDLVPHAVRAIKLGIEDYKTDDEDRLDSAIRNLTAGMLLIFKEKLRQLSPPNSNEALLKRKATLALANDGSLTLVGEGRNTVNVYEIQDRFKSLDVKVDWIRVDRTIRIRNDIEHYFTESTPAQIEEAISSVFMIIRDFLTNELQTDPATTLPEETWAIMLKVSEVYEAERESCLYAIEEADWPLEALMEGAKYLACHTCGSTLLSPTATPTTAQSPTLRCRSCKHEMAHEDYAVSAIASVPVDHREIAQGGDYQTTICPECGNETYVYEEDICAFCFETVNGDCARCGQQLGPDNTSIWDPSYCEYCVSKLERD